MNENAHAVITKRTKLREQFVNQLQVVVDAEALLKQLELDAKTVEKKSDEPVDILAAKQAVRDQADVVDNERELRNALESAVKTANENASRV